MKAKKKRVGTKAQIKAAKERQRHVITTVFLVFILLVIIVSAYFAYAYLNQPQNLTSSYPKAAIVDHLSLSMSNPAFIKIVTDTLKSAGFAVDYYPPRKVTVDFYRNLPTHDYDLVIFRTHSAIYGLDEEVGVGLYTSEPYSTTKYVLEQLDDRFMIGIYPDDGLEYFGILPNFVKYSMIGEYRNTTIIMMGCDGLRNTVTAQAFVEKGAKAYISWSGPVSVGHTDQATTQLLKHLITENQTVKNSVEQTNEEVGADPSYESQLLYYPLEAGEQTIENIKSEN